MPYLSQKELFLPRTDGEGAPTDDNFWHTLPSPAGPKSIAGYMGDDDWQGSWFYNLGWMTRGTAVELGSFYGLSSAYFAMGMRDSPWQEGKLICIDWFGSVPYLAGDNTVERFLGNMKTFGVEKYVTAVQGSCEDPNIIPFTLLEWILFDASHCLKELRVNEEIFYPMLKPGALLIWHDTHMQEVLGHIEECRQRHGITPVITSRPDFQAWMKPMENKELGNFICDLWEKKFQEESSLNPVDCAP